jgi:hypothetical protein
MPGGPAARAAIGDDELRAMIMRRRPRKPRRWPLDHPAQAAAKAGGER